MKPDPFLTSPGQDRARRGSGRTPFISYHASPPPPGPATPNPRLNIFLFLATVLTTMVAGSYHNGVNPFVSLDNLFKGIPYSAAILGILLAHEMGHYLTSRYYGVAASLPYFIPVPPPFILGTAGAIIRMRSAVRNRRILFDIGIAGPLAGMVVAVPVTIIGLLHSKVIVTAGVGGIMLGDSLLFKIITQWIFGPLPDSKTVLLHPVAFAGWLGFFVTSLNLIPIGQLDGGHVLYGIFGPRHRNLSRLFFLCLLFWGVHGAFTVLNPLEWIWALAFCWTAIRMAFSFQRGHLLRFLTVFLFLFGLFQNFVPETLTWLLWATLLCFLRLEHPPTRDLAVPLDPKRKILGWVALILFVLTFIPQPFQLPFE